MIKSKEDIYLLMNNAQMNLRINLPKSVKKRIMPWKIDISMIKKQWILLKRKECQLKRRKLEICLDIKIFLEKKLLKK